MCQKSDKRNLVYITHVCVCGFGKLSLNLKFPFLLPSLKSIYIDFPRMILDVHYPVFPQLAKKSVMPVQLVIIRMMMMMIARMRDMNIDQP